MASTIDLTKLSASKVVTSDAQGQLTLSSVTSTEMGYLSGVTSAVQTQLNAKAATASPTLSGVLKITPQYVAPTTGDTVTMTSSILIIHATGTLVALTVVLPTSPVNGTVARIATDQIITTLTITGTIVGTLTTLALGGYAEFVYDSNNSKWFRIG